MEPERVIFHIDVNSAFLSWESVYRMKELGEKLDLRTIPAAIGGDEKETPWNYSGKIHSGEKIRGSYRREYHGGKAEMS